MNEPYKIEHVGTEEVEFKALKYTLPSGAIVTVLQTIKQESELPKHAGRYKVELESGGSNGKNTTLEFGLSDDAYTALVQAFVTFNGED